MTRPWLGSFAGLMMGVLACGGDDGGGSGTGESTGSETGSTTNTTATTNPTTTMTSTVTADGSGSTSLTDTGPGESSSGGTGSTGPETTTTDPDSSGGGSSDGGSSSGGMGGVAYPECMADEDCPEPYTLCWPPMEFGTPNFCTLECADPADCPAPTSGQAVVACEGPPGQDICVLDCTDGACPDGMECVDVFGDGNFMRCTFAP